MREKTSIKVLLDWIASGKNYWRRKTYPDSRPKFCADIKTLLAVQGIKHRSTMDICKKIKQLEISVVYAKSLLDEEGLSGSTTLDVCNPRLKSKIMRCCVHFRVLAPILMNYVRTHGENNRSVKGQRSNEIMDEEKASEAIKTPVKAADKPKTQSPDDLAAVKLEEKRRDLLHTHSTQPESVKKRLELAPESLTAEQANKPQQFDAGSPERLTAEPPKTYLKVIARSSKCTPREETRMRERATTEPTEKHQQLAVQSPERPAPDESRVKEAQRNSWHSDQVRGKTSIEVLLDWIAEGRNYDRWKCGQFSTERLCHVINIFLQRQGIRNRTNTDIMNKIELLEGSVARAVAHLATHGKHHVLSLKGDFDASLKASTLEICPFFEILAPFMMAFATHQRKDNANPKPVDTQALEPSDPVSASPSSVEKHPKPAQAVEQPPSKEKRQQDTQSLRTQEIARPPSTRNPEPDKSTPASPVIEQPLSKRKHEQDTVTSSPNPIRAQVISQPRSTRNQESVKTTPCSVEKESKPTQAMEQSRSVGKLELVARSSSPVPITTQVIDQPSSTRTIESVIQKISHFVGGKTSLSVLLEWITIDGNYTRWKGGDITRETLCDEINVLLDRHGIRRRTHGDIQVTIRRLEMSFTRATSFIDQNKGRMPVVLNDCSVYFKSKILEFCPFYEILVSVMMSSTNAVSIQTFRTPNKCKRRTQQSRSLTREAIATSVRCH